MTSPLLHRALATAGAGLLVTLAACTGSEADPTSTRAATSTSPTPAATTTAAGNPIELPEFPVPRVPDVGTLTKAAGTIETAIAGAEPLPDGLTVTGARCDTSGRVINRAGANIPTAGQATNRGGTKQVDADGSGQTTDGDSVYQVSADGSGQVVAAGATLQVSADGSGQATVGTTTYQVDADGSGQVVTGTETYQVDADGSGQWTGPLGTVTNDGQGSGTWTGPDGALVVNGDGTGTLNGAPVQVAAMAPFTPLGTLPKLQKLKPLGQRCGTLIRIDAGVLFDFDKAEIRPAAEPVLAAIAKTLTSKSAQVDVDGHTDAKGSDTYNLDLSQRRAEAVVAELTSAGAVADLTAHGYGESRPVARNTIGGKDNPAGRQLNRRVEVVLRNS